MLTETFIKVDPSKVPSSNEAQDETARHQTLLQQTGFVKVFDWEKQIAGSFNMATAVYPELVTTSREFRLWKRFLPTVTTLEDFKFNSPPSEALEAIQTAQGLKCFQRIEIWSPEGNTFAEQVKHKLDGVATSMSRLGDKMKDPMAVGVVQDVHGGHHYFQITSWGEALLSVRSINWHVRSVRFKWTMLLAILPFVAIVAGIAAYINGIDQNGFGPMFGFTLIGALAVVFIGMIMCAAMDSRKRDRLRAKREAERRELYLAQEGQQYGGGGGSY